MTSPVRADIDAIVDRKAARAAQAEAPTYSETDGERGTAACVAPENATKRELIVFSGLDPELWMISGKVNTRVWMANAGRDPDTGEVTLVKMHYYKFDVVAGESPEAAEEHVGELVRRIRSRRPSKPEVGGDDAFLFMMSDLQLGKAEGAVGTSDTVEAYCDTVDQAAARIKGLRRAGAHMPQLGIVGTGDIVESCTNFYANQAFLVDRNQRDQNRLAREVGYYTIDTLAPLFDEVKVGCVGGNHGENRNDGKKATDDADNADVAFFECLREAYDRAGDPFGIDWTIPHDELSIMMTLGGVNVGFTHGHIFRRGSTAQQKALEWFRGQVFGYGAVADAQILVSGHFHHFLATSVGLRTLFQTPAIDPGSKHFEDGSGDRTPPGVLTMRLTRDNPMGFDDLAILQPGRDQLVKRGFLTA